MMETYRFNRLKMKCLLFILITSLSPNFLLSSTNSFTSEHNIIILTDSNFQNAITTYKYLLVNMYAPWCGYCSTMNLEFIQVGILLEQEYIGIGYNRFFMENSD